MKRLAAILIALGCLTGSAHGLTDQERHALIFDSVWYLPGQGGSSCTGSVPSTVNLPKPVLDAINQNQSVYTEASEQTGVPWELFAAIHFKETNLKPYNPGNGQGIYQVTTGGFPPASSVGRDEFLRQSVNAGKILQQKAQGSNLPQNRKPLTKTGNDPNVIKDTMFSYNGRAKIYADQAARLGFDAATQPFEGSPYVMNDFDDRHKGMLQDVADKGVNLQPARGPGAFVIYAALTGQGGGGCSGATGNKLVDIAIQQIGLKEVPVGSNSGPEIAKFLGSSKGEEWCADFLSWVYKEAGSPLKGDIDGWRIAGAVRLAEYFKTHGVWTDRSASGAEPRPGDVVLFSRGLGQFHVGMVEKIDGQSMHTIEGNTSKGEVARRQYNYRSDSNVIGWGGLK